MSDLAFDFIFGIASLVLIIVFVFATIGASRGSADPWEY